MSHCVDFGKEFVEDDNAFGSRQLYEAEIQSGAAALFPNVADFHATGLQSPPAFNTLALRMGYAVGNGTYVGISAGQNSFALQYKSQPNALTTISYSQYSNVVYGGLYMRQLFGQFIGTTSSMLLEIGGSSLGPLASAQLSFAIPITRTVAFDLAGIATGLFYLHNNTWYASEKAGVMFGLKRVF